MGIYLNPGNDLFRQAVKSKIYVDKSMMISITNSVLDTSDKHLCISRPRRFGKSMAANMLTAYYSRGCDSADLFKNLAISKTDDFEKHLNKYNVLKFDVRGFASKATNGKVMTDKLIKSLKRDLKKGYRDMDFSDDFSLEEMLGEIYDEYKVPFVFVIDEWDCVFRVFKNDTEGQKYYLDFYLPAEIIYVKMRKPPHFITRWFSHFSWLFFNSPIFLYHPYRNNVVIRINCRKLRSHADNRSFSSWYGSLVQDTK